MKRFGLIHTKVLDSLSFRGAVGTKQSQGKIATPACRNAFFPNAVFGRSALRCGGTSFGLAMTYKNSKCVLMNSKGISILFLVIAMLLMIAIGYVFSYLIPTKQKSVVFAIQSNQAFFIAQSGVEFAVRYAYTQTPPWTTTGQLDGLDGMTRNLGVGRFVLDYDSANDTLHSLGEVPIGTERRRISVSKFTSFLPRLTLALGYDVPCWCQGTSRARFYIQNVGGSDIAVNAFSGSWNSSGQPKTIERIDMGVTTPLVQKYAGDYVNGSLPPANFNMGGGSQTITPGQVIEVVINWSKNTNADNIFITFYDIFGTPYTFSLDPEGRGLDSCPHPC